ncbi:WG repeat-containing protein [Pseudomonas xanthosomatis]|uniref:WG repeat-containing protein n=1 Tax=Pseudomonas xanthosomatis TaxID=2842356 RepID=UPI00351706F9
MGNRAWLYLQSEQDGDAPSREIASSNNTLPTLWQILLASSEITPSDTTQRVFGDAGTDGLRAPARAAHERLFQVAAFLIGRETDKGLQYCLQLEGAALWLERLLDEDYEGCECWFNANLDELCWLDDSAPAGFAAAVRQECNERWLALRERMAAGDVPGVLKLLNVSDLQDQSDWAWRFGLGGLDHPYFAEAEEPIEVCFEEYEAETAIDDAYLGGGLYRFEVQGLWGIRAGRDERAARVSAPRYQAIWPFDAGVAAVLLDDKVGLIDRAGNQVLACELDAVCDFAQGLAAAQVGKLFGFIDPSGNWVITPRFVDAGDFSPANQAAAREGEHWGVIDRQGNWVVAPTWYDIDWNEGLHAWIPRRNGLRGLIDTQGHLVVEPQYEALEVFVTEIDATEQWADGSLRMVVGDYEQSGMLDCSGKLLVPVAYTSIGYLSWLPSRGISDEDPAPAGEANRYVQVSKCVEYKGGWEQWFKNVYDTREGREVLPFVHEVVGLKWGTGYGWFCTIAPDEPGVHAREGLHTGIANSDGSWLHEPIYGWVVKKDLKAWERDMLIEHWNRCAPVPAQRADDGALVLLHADGRVEPAPVQAGMFEA